MKIIVLLISFFFCIRGINAQENFFNDTTQIFTGTPDSLPFFKGGKAAWNKFLQRNLNANISVDNGGLNGTFNPLLSFIVNENGLISDIKLKEMINMELLQNLLEL